MARQFTRTCPVCEKKFSQIGIRGTLRKMCSDTCSLRRIRERKNRNYMQRYHAVREAGGDRQFRRWAMQGRVRTEAAIEVLKDSNGNQ